MNLIMIMCFNHEGYTCGIDREMGRYRTVGSAYVCMHASESKCMCSVSDGASALQPGTVSSSYH